MSSEYVEPGFVAEGFVVGETTPSTDTPDASLTPNRHWTDHREYRRGRLPGDMVERWAVGSGSRVEGATYDLAHRNSLRCFAGLADRAAVTWSAPDNDTGHANQELYLLIRPIEDTGGNRVIVPSLRVAGGTGTESAYRIVFTATSWTLNKIVSNVSTNLGSAVTFAMPLGGWYLVRFRANGTSIQGKVWRYGSDEPGWQSTVTDSALSDGHIGFHIVSGGSTGHTDISFIGIGTNGESAPDLGIISETLDEWISEPDEDIELLDRYEYYNPATDDVEEFWVSSHGRSRNPFADYPSSIIAEPLLLDAGILSTRLEADAHLGGAALPTRTAKRLSNLPIDGVGPLDHWSELSFSGRPVETRIGKRWLRKPRGVIEGILTPYRRFEIVGCSVIGNRSGGGAGNGGTEQSQEPQVTTEEAIIPVASPISMLTDRIPSYRNIGVPTGIKSLSTSGWLSIPNNTAYSLSEFTVSLRAYLPAAGVAGSGAAMLTRRGTTGGTDIQWQVAFHHASSASAHKLQLNAYANDGTSMIAVVSTNRYNLGRFVDIVVGIRGLDRWYWYADGVLVAEGVLTKTPAAPTTVVEVMRAAVGVIICDHRIEKWFEDEKALSRFSARREPDAMTVSMHRCDDNGGSGVADYAALGNDGTLQGTDGVDRSWVATYLGSADLAGVPMPISGGVLYHAPTQSIDPVREGFRFNDRAKTTGASVEGRAKGLLLTGGGVNYSEPTEGPGTIDIVGASDQPVTYGLAVSGSPESERIHVPRLVRDELINRGALDATTCDQDSFAAVRTLLPMKGGFHYQEAPTVADFLTQQIGSIASHYTLDRDARAAAGCVVTTLNPGPYGQEPMLEFLGFPNRGVTFSANSAFDLDDVLASGNPWFGVAAWVKFPRSLWKDPSASMGTYLPTGMTIVDRVDGAAGYYLGIDGRDGSIVFGAPGVTGDSTGLHYLSYFYPFRADRAYFIYGYQDANSRSIGVYSMEDTTVALVTSASELTTGGMTVATNAPLRIGHGPRGSFYGWIGYVIGSSDALGENDFVNISGDPFNIRTTRLSEDNLSASRWARTRYLVPLGEGAGDVAIEAKTGAAGIIEGCRWCPRLTLDFRSAAESVLVGTRAPIPAWRVEGRYKENRAPLVGANVVAGVSAEDRLALGQPYLSEPDPSEDVRTNYLNSRDIPLQTPLLTQADADAIAALLKARMDPDSRFAGGDWHRELMKLSLTDEVLVYHERFGLDVGVPMRAVYLVVNLNVRTGEGRGSGSGLGGEIEAWGFVPE